jgi:predicted dehydrogenase
MTIKIAFTGTGWASQTHAKWAKTFHDTELVAVVNHKPESRTTFMEKFGIPHQYQTVDEMLSHVHPDALIVNTPNYLHAPETIAALKAGVHVMVEKPMSMNAIEAAEMVRTAEKSKKILMVAHCFRFDPEVVWMKNQTTRLGKIIHSTSYGVHVAWGPGGWFTQPSFAGGGAMADMGIHALDTTRFLLGEPKPVSVYARIGTYYKPIGVDDTGVIIVTWRDGSLSYFESGWWQPHSDGICAATRLYGTLGYGRVYPTALELLNEAGDKVTPVESGFAPSRITDEFETMYQVQMKNFLDGIRIGRQPDPDPADSLVNMQIVDAAYKSSATGELVRL